MASWAQKEGPASTFTLHGLVGSHVPGTCLRGAWLAQWEECGTLDLRVISLNPTLGSMLDVEPT